MKDLACARYICARVGNPPCVPAPRAQSARLFKEADLNGLYQEQAAKEMGISRPTFSRIVEGVRRKVADALIHGKALRVEGGAVKMKGEQTSCE